MPHKYEVYVSSVGSVYVGSSLTQAEVNIHQHVSCNNVTLFRDGTILRQELTNRRNDCDRNQSNSTTIQTVGREQKEASSVEVFLNQA